ncbi:MAG: hypothetical protein FWF44_05555, partial [Defluviitaleaceae bacterium]|nr:hypothetical protein [Defluviitaleaceae bacterium]
MNKNLKKIAALLLASGMIIGLLTTAPNAVSGRGEGWSVTQSASGSVKIAEDCFNGYVADISQYPSPTFTFGAEGSNAKAGSLRVVGTIYIPYYAAPVSKEVPDNIEPGASFELGDFTCSPDGFASMTPMGLVELNPSRENITMDNYTLNGLFKDCDTRYYAYQFEWDFDNVSQNDTKTCTVEIDNLSFTAGDDARIFSGDSSLAGSDNQGVLFLAKTELYSAGVVEQPADITPTIPPVDVDPVTSGGAIDAASDEQAQDSVVATIPPEDAAVTVFDVNNATADGTANAASLPAAAASDLVADNTADGGYSDYTASQSYMGIMYYVPSMSSASANINAAVSADTVGAVILMSSMLINDDIKSASEPEAVNSGETFSVNMVVSVSSALSGYNDTAVIRLKIQDESGNPSQFLEWVPQSASNISGYLKAGGISVVNGPNGLDYVDLPLNIDAMKIAGEAVKISVSFRFTNGVTPDGASVTIGGHMLVDNIEVDAQDSMSVQATSAAHSKWTVGQSVEKPLVTMPDLNAGDDAYIGMNKTDPLISNYFTFTATNKMITSPDNISLPNGYYQAGTLFTTSFKLTGQVLIPWYVCPEGVNFDPTGYVCDPNNADPRDPGSQFTRESFTYATGMDPDLVGGFTLLPNTMSVNIGSSANNNPYNMNTNGVAKWKDADMKYYVYQFTWTVNNGDFVYDGSANLWDYNDPATGATLATYDPATGTWSQMVDLSTISRTVTLQNYHFAAEPYSQLFNPDVPTFAGGYAAIFFASASGWNTEIEPAGAAQAWIPAPMDTNSSYNVKAVYYTQQSSNDNTIPNPNKIPFEKTAWPQSSIPGDNTTIQPYFILSGIDNIYDGSQSSGGVNYKIEPLSSLYFIDGFVDSHNVPAGLEASQNNVFSVLVPFSVDTGTYTIQPSGSASADTGLMAAYSTMRLNIYYTTASDPYSTTDWNLGYTFNPFNSNGTANTNQTVYFENAPGGAASMNLSAIRGNYSTLDMAVGAITGVKYDYVNTASSGLIPPGFKTADNSAACPKIFFQNPANDDLANFGRTPRGNGADGNPLPLIGTLPNSAQLHYTRNGSATEDTPVPANASIVYVQPGSLIVSDTKTADNATYPGQDGVKKLYYPGNTVAYTLYMQNVSGNGTTMPLNSLVIHDAPDKLLVSMDADASVNWTMQGAVSNISYQVWNSSNRIVIPATPITTWSYVNGELLFDLTGVDATQAVADGGTLVITYDLKLPEYADFNGYDPDTSFPVSLDNTFTANVTASDIPNNGKITIEVKGDVPLVSLTKDVVPNQTGQYYPGGTVDYAITASHLEGGFDNSMNQYGTNVVVLKDVFASNNFDLSYSSSPDGTPDILSSIQVKYYPADGSGAYTDATGAHYDLVSKDTAYSGAYSDYTGDGYLLYPVYPADGLQYPDASVSPADYYKYNDFSIALNRDTYFGVGDKIVVTFTAKIGNIGTGDGSVNFPAGQSTVDLKNNADLFLSPNKVTINYLLPSTGGTIDGGTVPIPGGGSIDYNWG